jgi:hypothetical protein
VKVEIDEFGIVIEIHNLGVFPPHALNPPKEGMFLPQCRLVFEGVKKSERVIYEYLTDEKTPGIKPSYVVVDGPFSNPLEENPSATYSLEGILKKPLAWVDWTIESNSFYLEIH